MPRVLHVLSSFARGGAETNTSRLIPGLAARGFEQQVVSLTPQVDEALAAALPVPLSAPAIPLRFPASARFLARIVDAFRPDVIHGRAYRTWLDCVVGAGVANRRAQVVQSFHGSTSFELAPRRRQAAACLMEPATAMFVAVSRHLAGRIHRQWHIAARRVRVIHNGIDADHFEPQDREQAKHRLGIEPGQFVVGSVGSLRQVKNHGLLIAAFAAFHRRHPGSLLLLVGDGPLRGTLQHQALNGGIADAVRFCGRQSAVAPYLAAMDVFVQPSLMEGSPTAVLEAMSSGVACVAVRSTGCSELSGLTGQPVLVDARGSLTLTDWLARLAADAAMCRSLGTAGRAEVQRGFTLQRMVGDYATVYHSVISGLANGQAGVQ